ncbi:MAG: hypothetical protein PHP50_09610 [Lachnospiraceae bacterium]|nr:hypothetical protein [Lachnospiraceae bacterium]
MVDLPHPQILATTTEDQVTQIYNYLIQLKEEIEFYLQNISSDNLSQNFVQQLVSMQDMIAATRTDAMDAQAMAQSGRITIEDVIKSSLFKNVIDETKKEVNTYTDNSVSAMETKLKQDIAATAEKTLQEAKAYTDLFEYKITVNYETGELEYNKVRKES